MYIKDLADKTGVEQEELEQFIKLKGYEVTSIFGISSQLMMILQKKQKKKYLKKKSKKIKQKRKKDI